MSAAERAGAAFGGRVLAIRDGVSGAITVAALNSAISGRDTVEKRYVEQMRGEIAVTSGPGRARLSGSGFRT